MIWRILTIFAVVAVGLNSVPQDDTWRHLALGRLFTEIGGLPKLEPFGIFVSDPRFIDYSWVSCWVFYWIHRLLDEPGLIIASALMFAFTLDLAVLPGEKGCKHTVVWWLTRALVLISVAFAVRWRITARPEVFGLFFFTLCCRLAASEYASRWKWPFLAAIVVLWNNFHATAGLVLGIWGLTMVGAVFQKNTVGIKRALLGLAIASAALFVNPWGWRLIRESLMQGLLPINQFIFEFQSLHFDTWFPFRAPLIFLCVGATMYRGWRQKCFLGELPLLLGTLALSLKYSRCLPYIYLLTAKNLVMLTTEILEPLLQGVRKKLTFAVLVLSCWGAYLCISFNEYYGNHFARLDYMRGIDLLVSTKAGPEIFNDFAMGGYLMWAGGGRYKLYIDNRSPIYAKTTFPKYLQNSILEVCKKELGATSYDAIVLPAPRYCGPRHALESGICGTAPGCIEKKDWSLIYFSDSVLVYLRKREGLKADVDRYGFSWIDAVELRIPVIAARMSQMLALPGAGAGIKAEIDRALQMDPENSRAHAYLQIFTQLSAGVPPGNVH